MTSTEARAQQMHRYIAQHEPVTFNQLEQVFRHTFKRTTLRWLLTAGRIICATVKCSRTTHNTFITTGF